LPDFPHFGVHAVPARLLPDPEWPRRDFPQISASETPNLCVLPLWELKSSADFGNFLAAAPIFGMRRKVGIFDPQTLDPDVQRPSNVAAPRYPLSASASAKVFPRPTEPVSQR